MKRPFKCYQPTRAILPIAFLQRIGLLLLCASFLAACDHAPATPHAKPASFSISGTVLDEEENPIADATVGLHNSAGNITATTITNSAGVYTFSGLAKGEYSVVTHRAGYQFSTLSRSVNISETSIRELNCVGTPVAGAGLGTSATATYTLSGRVVDALNVPISDVAIALSGDATASTRTNANGRYSFTKLARGAYTVTPTFTGLSFTPVSRAVTITRFSARRVNFTSTDALPNATTYSISGRITTNTGGALRGATVSVSGAGTGSVVTDANGEYTISTLGNGTYTVTPSMTGYTFTPATRTATINNADVADINYAGTPPAPATYALSGRIIKSNGNALSGVTIALTGAATRSATSDSNGDYSIPGLSPGDYVVTPSLTGYTFTPTKQTVAVTNIDVAMIDFTAAPPQNATYTLSGQVTSGANTALSGATVTLSGAADATATTDASGNYSFANLGNGDYAVTPTKNGYTFVPSDTLVTINGDNVANINFAGTATAVTTYTISGQVTAAANAPVSGATVTLSGATTTSVTTDASGQYTFVNLVNGDYTVTPTLANYTFAPPQIAVTVNGANVTNTNFSGTQTVVLTYTISGKITTGTNTALSGATVALSGAATASATSDANGDYSFTNLANGSYTVTPTKSGYTFAPTNLPVTVSGVDVTNTNFSGTQSVVATYSISGTVADANGVAISGVTITQGTTTVTTDSAGAYTLTGLGNGSYTLTPSLTGYSFTPPTTNVTLNGANITATDFVAVAPTPGVRNFTLYIKPGTLTVSGRGGAAIPAWSFTDVAATPKFPGAVLNVTEGDTVRVTVQNDHTIDHNFAINGITVDTAAAVAAGANKVYTFTATNAGAYLYYDGLNDNINREMGLYGAIVVAPVSGGATAWTGGPEYSFQRVWVTGDMDKTRWNDVASAGNAVNTAIYKANYFLINGMGGEDAMQDKAKTAIDGRVGQTALVRILNAG
ncbi:MAG: carboxypeptidase regulatory-like domain-containing protein, partial [Gammaproteobacteria bacterium]|nr:carboxypeptidase regulatory-like domain-containing protein [Gammaproteobacteria bacterium]